METSESLTYTVKYLAPGYKSIDINKSITLPFHLFVELLLGIKHAVYIDDKQVADIIAATDFEEQLVHVQVLPVTAERTKEIYGIWRIEEWKATYAVYLDNKAKADADNANYFKRKENVDKLCRAMCDKTGLGYDEMISVAAKLYDNKAALCKGYVEDIEFV